MNEARQQLDAIAQNQAKIAEQQTAKSNEQTHSLELTIRKIAEEAFAKNFFELKKVNLVHEGGDKYKASFAAQKERQFEVLATYDWRGVMLESPVETEPLTQTAVSNGISSFTPPTATNKMELEVREAIENSNPDIKIKKFSLVHLSGINYEATYTMEDEIYREIEMAYDGQNLILSSSNSLATLLSPEPTLTEHNALFQAQTITPSHTSSSTTPSAKPSDPMQDFSSKWKYMSGDEKQRAANYLGEHSVNGVSTQQYYDFFQGIQETEMPR